MPAATVEATVMVAVEPPPEVTEPGLRPTVMPVGEEALSVTASEAPAVTAVVMLAVPLAPAAMVGEVAAMLKSLVGGAVVVPARAATRAGFGLPQPVTRSNPVVAE